MIKVMRRSVMFFILMAFGGFVGCVLYELVLRAVEVSPLGYVLPLKEPQYGMPDKDIGYDFIPGAKGMWTSENRVWIEINSLGLRDALDMTVSKPDDVKRIALLGDSVVEGLQVEQSNLMDSVAERLLQKRGENIEIVNLAMSGAGPMRQLLLLEHKGLRLAPDEAFLMMSAGDFLGGALIDDSEFPSYQLQDNGTFARGDAYRQRFSQRHIDTPLGKGFAWIMRNSHAFRALYAYKSKRLWDFLSVRPPKLPNLTAESTPVVKLHSGGCEDAVIADMYKYWVGHQPELNWRAMHWWLKDLQEKSAEHSMSITIALYIRLAEKGCSSDFGRRSEIVSAMRNVFGSYDVEFVDWYAQLHTYMGQELYKNTEVDQLKGFGLRLKQGHLNYKGHQIYGAVLAEELRASP